MRIFLIIPVLALCACDPPPQPVEEDAAPTVVIPSRPTSFTTNRASPSTRWQISAAPGITISGNFSKTLTGNATVTCIPPDGYVVLEWTGVLRFDGQTAEVAPNTPNVVAVLAQLANG